ncbi:MAG: DUF799 family lipoprotein [Calditrichaceae bacterium]|nr:DUF799 family lipoprotein [Calditrichaceae bacterium]MBN2709792.1 DUF799 family lipoprotein [Calditrichaceae bacterium]RQV94986.1 MAG: hypothetical protein EH224_08920 [Calditrichota bacterium]
MIKIIKISLLVIIMTSISFISCNPTMTKLDAFPKMYEEQPVSVLVLPPINETTAAEATDYYTTTIAEPLAESGFYVFPIEVINQILQEQGLYENIDYENLPIAKFWEYFGADALLITKILKWDTSYYVIGGNVTVSIDFQLMSTKTGEIIWKYNGTIQVDTSGDSGNAPGFAGLLASVITTAIQTAATDYVPQAKKANIQALQSIPVGKYHSQHNKDQNRKVVEKRKVDQHPKGEVTTKENKN